MSNLRSLNIPGLQLVWLDGEVITLLKSAQGEVGQDVQRRAYAVQKRMKRLAPVWSGELRRGIRVQSVRTSNIGPYSKVVSDAPHTLVAEFGRREVYASGSGSSEANRQRTGPSKAKTKLTWAQDRGLKPGKKPKALKIRLTPGGAFYYAEKAGRAAGSKFMEGSIDAAID